MRQNICVCGGTFVRKGNYYVCPFCDAKKMIDAGNDLHAVQRANAWEALRNHDFEKAEELFDELIMQDADNHEAYWGRALAGNGIVYVADYAENKRVPTCNNISKESFLQNKDYLKAVALADDTIGQSYTNQAKLIEKIRVEWLQKASKEKPFDVFICYKDSDRANGIDRTVDSVDAQDLYTALTKKGYNVFYSRVTLQDKVAEHYEPYIYNALQTAKVMIVFGENASYFNSTWVKNEWSRYKKLIDKGQKHPNSLVVVYKNVNPYDIPRALVGGRQALDLGVASNYEALTNHVKRVIDESTHAATLERVKVAGGVAKKSTKIQTATLQRRELGATSVAPIDINQQQAIDLACSYMASRQWADASKLLDGVLFDNPNCAEAIWGKLKVKHQVASDVMMLKKVATFDNADFDTLTRLLCCAEVAFATKILNGLYDIAGKTDKETRLKILQIVLPFDYPQRKKQLQHFFDWAIASKNQTLFSLLLSALDANSVDEYVHYNLAFANATKEMSARQWCIANVLSVDEGNAQALNMKLNLCLSNDNLQAMLQTLENLIKYTASSTQEVCDIVVYALQKIGKTLNSKQACVAFKEVLKFYPDDLAQIEDLLVSTAYMMIRQSFFDHAEFLLGVALSTGVNDHRIYWGICLVKTKSPTEQDIQYSRISLKDLPEYTKYLTLVNEVRRKRCFKLAEMQLQQQKLRKRKKVVAWSLLSVLAVAVATVLYFTLT